MGREIMNSDLEYRIRCSEEHPLRRAFRGFGDVGLHLEGRVQSGTSTLTPLVSGTFRYQLLSDIA